MDMRMRRGDGTGRGEQSAGTWESILGECSDVFVKQHVEMMEAMIVELRRRDTEVCAYTVYKQVAIILLNFEE